jgi:16S rRNA C967 or C1407 C5-methylase (RsmB/RsmF family)
VSINPRFVQYFQETFFADTPDEFQLFLASLEKGIPRTIRIKPGKVQEVIMHLESYGFTLTPTSIENVFSLGRSDDFDPLERRIGYTADHLVGNFYIQELAAATSVHILSDGQIHHDEFVILDMAASPWGKTTQLREQYPNSFIIANEPTRERIPQLLQNLDRMGSENIGVTLYPGQYFHNTPEIFDRILLDAPCSGEGTLYKGTDATKHWHIKNIKTIARLQEKLLDAALVALKVGWEMLYSTCSMNLLENEWVLKAIENKYPQSFRITYQKRFWPHRDQTGGFFVAKIEKYAHIESPTKAREVHVNEELRVYKSNIGGIHLHKDIILYEHTGKILALKKHKELENLRKIFYFMRFGEKIWSHNTGETLLDGWIFRYIDTSSYREYRITDEKELDRYLRGESLSLNEWDGYILIMYKETPLSLEEIHDGSSTNRFPHDWRRK